MHADTEPDGQPSRRELLHGPQVRLVGQPAAAILDRVRQAEQPGSAYHGKQVAREAAGLLRGRSRWPHLPFDELIGELEKCGYVVPPVL